MKLNTKHSHSDFWLDEFDMKSDESNDTTQLIKLSMARRAISNFVNILSGKRIDVVFNESNQNMTNGDIVYISSDINDSSDFDVAVGLALHEGSHVLLTDFDVVKTLWQNTPRELYNIAEPKGFSKSDVAEHLKDILNYIEDRYIDNYIYTTAPGYRGYYVSLYNKYFHSDKISEMLKSDLYRSLDVESYDARLINLTNSATDLNALPGLREIAKTIDIRHIDRLIATEDRFEIAIEVAKIIYSNVKPVDTDDVPNPSGSSGSSGSSSGCSSDQTDGGSTNSDKDTSDEADDVDDVLGGGTSHIDSAAKEISKENVDKNNQLSDISKTKQNSIKKALKKQKEFIRGNVKKKKLSSKENNILTQMDAAGVTIVNVGKNILDGQPLVKGIDCIVVKNLTTDLLFSDQFPCGGHSEMVTKENLNAVNRGIQLGHLLGKRLKIRSEVNLTKYTRKSSGKIDRRILADIGFQNENIFYKVDVDKYNSAFIHISLDASGSMGGNKWINAITSVTAICKAASMIDNLRVSVSIRTTTMSSSHQLPYIAMVYDSNKDSFSKVRTMFPYLHPSGNTPEGLCFEAIMDLLDCKSHEQDYYFLNFSDGQPAYHYCINGVDFYYDHEVGGAHTRRQVNDIRNKGYKVLSYFIRQTSHVSSFYSCSPDDERCFKTMYGQDASFINVTNIISIAKTMNQMFLEKENKI